MDREKENEEKNKDMKHQVEMKERKLNNMQGIIMKGFYIPSSFGFRRETREIFIIFVWWYIERIKLVLKSFSGAWRGPELHVGLGVDRLCLPRDS